ncbi:hypothetical protein EVS84_24675 [Pseudomonas koreensis]|uniref:Uncharacterized protein n=2 Tax=Pseudomonas TaxID=286 RepID=A0A4Q4KWH9_9PSED|nr:MULTISPECIES: hypothetical protein [Pseudomonas]MDM8193620.1 hypothetical protein [Pseudomonas fluorescens]MDP8574865.1 hypothetical protein [Pseudomonas iranensis]RYM38239.1 hypothetical protein EVS84_24675 [Pseudomonas koreensis]
MTGKLIEKNAGTSVTTGQITFRRDHEAVIILNRSPFLYPLPDTGIGGGLFSASSFNDATQEATTIHLCYPKGLSSGTSHELILEDIRKQLLQGWELHFEGKAYEAVTGSMNIHTEANSREVYAVKGTYFFTTEEKIKIAGAFNLINSNPK